MSQENVEIVLAALEAWNRRDFDAAMSVADEDAEIHFVGGFADLIGEEYDGRERDPSLLARHAWNHRLAKSQSRPRSTRASKSSSSQLLKEPERRAVFPSRCGSGRFASFQDAKAIRLDFYYEPTEALEAAGLSE